MKILNPKEKAKELIESINSKMPAKLSPLRELGGGRVVLDSVDFRAYIDNAKKCAMVVVDEILNNFGLKAAGKMFYSNYSAIEYYQKVKIEIENYE